MNKYTYRGSVMIFDKCVTNRFMCETMAETEKKARNNMAAQYKRKNNLNYSSRVTLPDKIIMEGEY